MQQTPLEFLLASAAGGAIGVISGLFGVGGGFLLVPVLNIVLGVPMQFAVGAGACQVLGPATTSILARRMTFGQTRVPLIVSGGLMTGVYVGGQLLESAKAAGKVEIEGRSSSYADVIVLVLYFLLLTSLGLFALWESRRQRLGKPLRRGWLAGFYLPPQIDLPEFGKFSVPLLAWFGLAVGFFAGLLGMSGGLILLPGLIYLIGLNTQQSVQSSLVIVWIVALQATVFHAWYGNVNLALVMALLLGGTIGARVGSELSLKMGGPQLRQGFGWLLLGTAVMISYRLARLVLP